MIQRIIIIIFLFCYLIFSCSNPKEIPVVTPVPILVFGKLDDPHEAFHKPSDVETDSEGNIYVLDRGNHRVVKFDKYGKFLLEFGRFGQGPGELIDPVDFDIDKKNHIYILDVGNTRIEIFNSEGKRKSSFKIRGSPYLPITGRVALDSRRRIYINHPYNGKLIDVYSKEGKLIDSIGDYYSKNTKRQEESKNNITFFDFDKDDNLYILFFSFPIVRKYDRQYKLIFEHDISFLPVVKASMKKMMEMKKKAPDYLTFGYFFGLSVSPNGDYLVHSNPLFHFNTNGNLIQKIDTPAARIGLLGNNFLYCIKKKKDQGFWIVEKLIFP